MDPHIDSSPECLDYQELRETWKSGVLIKNLPEVSSDYFESDKQTCGVVVHGGQQSPYSSLNVILQVFVTGLGGLMVFTAQIKEGGLSYVVFPKGCKTNHQLFGTKQTNNLHKYYKIQPTNYLTD